MKPPRVDPLVLEFMQTWFRVHRDHWRRHNQLKKKYGLSPHQLGLLYHIHGMGPIHLSVLKRFVPGHLSAIGQMVDRLVQGGWLTRERDTRDRRRIVIDLTKKARKALARIEPFGLPRAAGALVRMSAAEKRKAVQAAAFIAELFGAGPSKGRRPFAGKKSNGGKR